MRVTKTFFRSPPLVALWSVEPVEVCPGLTLSDVKECASLLVRMLDRPKDPFPSPIYEFAIGSGFDSEGRM